MNPFDEYIETLKSAHMEEEFFKFEKVFLFIWDAIKQFRIHSRRLTRRIKANTWLELMILTIFLKG